MTKQELREMIGTPLTVEFSTWHWTAADVKDSGLPEHGIEDDKPGYYAQRRKADHSGYYKARRFATKESRDAHVERESTRLMRAAGANVGITLIKE